MSDLFDRARAALRVEDLAERAVKLTGRGDERRGHCPICLSGEKSRSQPFKVSVSRQTWRCFGSCDQGGDVVDLWAKLYDCGLAEAARTICGPELAGAPAPAPRRAAKAEPDPRDARIAAMAADMWTEAEYFWRSPVEAYLRHRGIAPAIVEQLDPGALRFNPAAPHHWDEAARAWIAAPAMVAKVETPAGSTGGVHVTYLRPDGLGKAQLAPSKRMWGPQSLETALGPAVGGAFLAGRDDHGGDLVVGEGIETVLSLASWLKAMGRVDRPRVAAALSLGRLQGGVSRDADGCMDMHRPKADPDRRPFLWPPCNTAPQGRLFLAIDRDMAPVRALGRNRRGKPLSFDLDAEARAILCGSLAAQAWRRAGWRRIEIMTPPRAKQDWNDAWRAAGGIDAHVSGGLD